MQPILFCIPRNDGYSVRVRYGRTEMGTFVEKEQSPFTDKTPEELVLAAALDLQSFAETSDTMQMFRYCGVTK